MPKVTYTCSASLDDAGHQAFESAFRHLDERLGRTHPLFIRGAAKKARAGTFNDCCPADTRKLLGKFPEAGREEVRLVVAAAREAFPEWVELGWPQRLAFLRKAADILEERQYRLAAILALEVGKPRTEAMAEACESIDLIRYYCDEMERHNGYEMPLRAAGPERTRSVLRPYGVWAVITPFSFPLALPAGMTAAALAAGNTVVFKPASNAPWTGLALYECLHDAGLPIGIFNLVTGPGETAGEELLTHPDIAGLAFTGSRTAGLHVIQKFNQDPARPRPGVVEMGGKNAVIVMPSAQLEDATEGVLRSAFGIAGQQGPACSRVYVHKDVYGRFVQMLADKARALRVGLPWDRSTAMGPLIDERAVQQYQRAVRLGQKDGRLLCGGHRLTRGDLAHGHFVEPAMVDQLPRASRLFQEEFCAPILALAEIRSLQEAVQLANATEGGMAAGIFTASESEQEYFFNGIQAGAAYANRGNGAITGAWPGVQSTGGWKASGSAGKNALGPFYVPLFMREQSQTIVRKQIPVTPPPPAAFVRRPVMAAA